MQLVKSKGCRDEMFSQLDPNQKLVRTLPKARNMTEVPQPHLRASVKLQQYQRGWMLSKKTSLFFRRGPPRQCTKH